ncbi:hypothetical protein E5288_WYG020297 [Bos mutus]|uniref:Uncharacterized protein n=1 Tax=Bos mutus TaxID=72004 RepID=A0A6B0SEA3_9CETA|nr:hypothetical protein [Bos mutus]
MWPLLSGVLASTLLLQPWTPSGGEGQTRVRSHSPDASGQFPALLPATQGHPRDRCEGPQSRCRRPATRNLRDRERVVLVYQLDMKTLALPTRGGSRQGRASEGSQLERRA